MATGRKKNHYIAHGGIKAIAVYPVFAFLLLKMVFMTRKIGVNGIAYYAMAFALFFVVYSLNGRLISECVRKMVLFQVNRRSVRNAIKLNRVILQYTWIVTILSSVLLFVFSDFVSKLLFKTLLVSLPIKLFAVALFFLVPQQCMKGYLEGISSPIPGVVSIFIEIVIDLITTIIVQNSFMQQGRKISLLMRNEQYYYSYASLGGIVGFCVGCFFSFLFLLLITGLLKQMQKERMRNDESKSKLGSKDILHNYLSNGLAEIIPCMFGPVMLLLFYVLFSHNSPEHYEQSGIVFIGLLSGLPVIMNAGMQGRFAFRQVHSLLRRHDHAMARDKVAFQVKSNLYCSFMISVFLAFSAKSFNLFLFDLSKEELISAFRYTQAIVLLYSIGMILLNLLMAYTVKVIVNLIYLSGIGALFVFELVFLKAGMSGVMTYISSLLMSLLWIVLIGGFLLFKKSRCKKDLIRVFVLPVIAAVGLMLVCLLIDQVLSASMGAFACLILCALLGYISYQLIIILTHTFDRYEWADVPFANVPIFIAKKLNMY